MSQEHERTLVFRCFGYPGKNNMVDGYYTECIDLDLIAWRPTTEAAKDTLNDAIRGYLETTLELHEQGEDVEHLLQRKSPLFPHRLHYHKTALQIKLYKKILDIRPSKEDAVVYDHRPNIHLPVAA